MQAIEAELKPLNKKVEQMKSEMKTLKNSLNAHVSITRKIKIFKKILKRLIYY